MKFKAGERAANHRQAGVRLGRVSSISHAQNQFVRFVDFYLQKTNYIFWKFISTDYVKDLTTNRAASYG